jgi:hypothetical protein
MLTVLNTKLLLTIIALLGAAAAYLGFQNHQLSVITQQVTEQNRRLAARDAEYQSDLAELNRYRQAERKKGSAWADPTKRLKTYVVP